MTPIELLRAMTRILRLYVDDFGSTAPLHEERWLIEEAECFLASVGDTYDYDELVAKCRPEGAFGHVTPKDRKAA